MDMTGEYRIPASREEVWEALNDPEVLRACIPGCESLDKTGDNQMTAKVTAKIGPVKASFTGEITLSNINAPESYTISGEGKGGAAGFAKGGADVTLSEDGRETVLQYTAKAQIGGKLAQIGSRLIDSTAKRMADQFFSAFAKRLSDEGQPASLGAAAVPVRHHTAPAGAEVGSEAEEEHTTMAEQAGQFAEEVEEEIETAAAKGVLGGPFVWGLLALVAIILLIIVLS